jgi:hypothetical protein
VGGGCGLWHTRQLLHPPALLAQLYIPCPNTAAPTPPRHPQGGDLSEFIHDALLAAPLLLALLAALAWGAWRLLRPRRARGGCSGDRGGGWRGERGVEMEMAEAEVEGLLLLSERSLQNQSGDGSPGAAAAGADAGRAH